MGEPGEAGGSDGSAGNEAAQPDGGEARQARGRRPRRAVREGTNPSAQDLPDVVPPREEPPPGESAQDRWLREQRPTHWE